MFQDILAMGSGGGASAKWWDEEIPASTTKTVTDVHNGVFYFKGTVFGNGYVCVIKDDVMVNDATGALLTTTYSNGTLTITTTSYTVNEIHVGYYS